MPAEFQLRQLDLTALMIFRDLVRYRDPNIVAEQLKLRTSTIAEYIRRMRLVFDDHLFNHSNDLMQPTPYALELVLKVETALEALNGILEDSKSHEWVYGRRLFRIAADENMSALIFHNAVNSIQEGASESSVSWRVSRQSEGFALLGRNQVDLVLCQDPEVGPDHVETVIATSRYAVVSRRSHSSIAGKLTIPSYLSLSHVEINTDGEFSGQPDATLKQLRLKRKTVVSAPSVEAACKLVSGTDIVATIPTILARIYARDFDLALTNLPFRQSPAKFSVVRHVHSDHDQTVAWLVERVKRSLVIG